MTYTHCRGCGVELKNEILAKEDGLCGKAHGCFFQFTAWLLARGLSLLDNNHVVPETPETAVALDEWLATR